MAIELVDDYYASGNTALGNYYGAWSGVSEKQKHNAIKIYNYFKALGWHDGAICGMIGNMQIESSLNPGLIEGGGRPYAPNNASVLSAMTNAIMIDFYKQAQPSYTGSGNPFGMGLVQWTGHGLATSVPYGQKLVSHAIRECNDTPWYYGSVQLNRIEWESENNGQWSSKRVNGTQWYWSNFITIDDPELGAHVWMVCYERPVFTEESLNRRKQNARQWYDYLTSQPTPPTPEPPANWVSGEYFANLALAYDGQYIPYSQWDCITFVQAVWHDIPTVNSSWVLCSPLGTNTLWRMNETGYPTKTFNTTSPFNQNPTPVLWYKDTISNCEQRYGSIPTGALLFHKISEAGPPAIPSQYAGDGIGNFAHVGIYCGNNEVMQSGGRDSSSVPGGGVHKSTYDPDAWNYVAFLVYVDSTTGGQPEPEPEPHLPLLYMYLMLYTKNKKGVTKNVKRFI